MKYYQNLIIIKTLVKLTLPDKYKLTAIFGLPDRTQRREIGIRVEEKNYRLQKL